MIIWLPNSLKRSIEARAAKEGIIVDQSMISAAGEELAVMQDTSPAVFRK